MTTSKDVYYVSGSTAILAEDMGKALLAQFQNIRFREEKLPFIQSPDDARKALDYIRKQSKGDKPLVFCTIMDPGCVRSPRGPILRHLPQYPGTA